MPELLADAVQANQPRVDDVLAQGAFPTASRGTMVTGVWFDAGAVLMAGQGLIVGRHR